MKRLTKIVPGLALLALLFATPAAVEEIIMVCTYKKIGSTYKLKYVDKWYGAPKVEKRGENGWGHIASFRPGDLLYSVLKNNSRMRLLDSSAPGTPTWTPTKHTVSEKTSVLKAIKG